ncbi:hypothetical protein [Flavobacterium sp.]|uniref:hypothetical protein n=1 Tax=Flavobacterium sp. TaxID=239 RepID=UPI0024871C19|nr:hypothetical protein [Flavobacterium sp.]MDI1315748.1 hypothetical protein [Flavobacterium sp.]
MKVILKNTFFLYLLASSITGSLYKILQSFNNKILIENVIYISVALIFSYLGYLADKKKFSK